MNSRLSHSGKRLKKTNLKFNMSIPVFIISSIFIYISCDYGYFLSIYKGDSFAPLIKSCARVLRLKQQRHLQMKMWNNFKIII